MYYVLMIILYTIPNGIKCFHKPCKSFFGLFCEFLILLLMDLLCTNDYIVYNTLIKKKSMIWKNVLITLIILYIKILYKMCDWIYIFLSLEYFYLYKK